MNRPFWACMVVLWLAAACNREQAAAHREFTQEDTLVEVAEQVEILYSDSAVVRVRITAPVLNNYADRETPRQEFPDGIHVDFLQRDQSITGTLYAKRGTRYQEKGKVVVRDSVVLNTAKAEKLETEELTWDERSGKISTEKFVKVTKPGEVIYGFGLDALQDFSYWKITVPKGRIKVEPLDQALE